MSTAPVLVEQTYQQKIAHNLEVALKSGSTWVVLVASTLATLYLSLDEAQKLALLANFPFLNGWVPVLTAVAVFIATKLRPSGSVSSQTKAFIDEIARLRLNDYLRKQGAAELPAPPPTPLPVAPPVMPVPPVLDEPLPEPRVERRRAAPPEPTVDIDPTSPQLPINPRLLLSLIAEYLREKPADKPVDPSYTAFVEMARNLNPDTTEAQIHKGWTQLKSRQLDHFSTPRK